MLSILKSIFRGYVNIPIFYKIFAGFAVGIALGAIFGEAVVGMQFLGTIMVRLISLVVIPLVICMMVVAVGEVGGKSMGKMGGLTTLIFTISTPFAIAIGLFFAFLFNVGDGIPAPDVVNGAVAAAGAPTFIETLVNIVPNNIFMAMSTANLLQVMTFSIFIGVAISAMNNRGHAFILIEWFKSFNEIMQKILGYAMGFMPFGVMGIMAWLVGSHGIAALFPFASFIFAIYAKTLAIFFIVQVLFMVRILGGYNMVNYLKAIKEPILFSYATNSSWATLPLAMASAKKLGIKDKIASFVVPYGIVINMDGSASYLAVATVFVANVFGIHLGIHEMLMIIIAATLGSFGAAGTPGAAVVMLNAILLMLGLPIEGVALLIGFDRLLIGPARSVLNMNGDLAVCTIVQRFVKEEPEGEEKLAEQPA
ncbi:MAG: dicarboxylate/amino acid:cation symporter [Treponema sp.]|nr:dicarboxylate/amino acid:cation symporter [Treponema sp.]